MTRHSCQVVWYCAKKVMVLKSTASSSCNSLLSD
uniref:Uncharacterized protein n=1 Tax=Anguilla anguilla TaxID=7936 RepID=A0A0E9TGB3_ANGAN